MDKPLKLILLVLLILFALGPSIAEGSQWYTTAYSKTVIGIWKVSPHVSNSRSYKLADQILEFSQRKNLDPLLLVALIRRESNFSFQIQNRMKFGPRDAMGLTQILPDSVALRHRPDGCSAWLKSSRCQIGTTANFLGHLKKVCAGSKTRWVASYGMSRCAKEGEMDYHRSIINIKKYYAQAGGIDPWS